MIHVISGDSADAVWRQAAKKVLSGDGTRIQESRLGPTHELLHVHFQILHPRKRWVYSRVPAINPAFAIAEAFWILSGSRDAKFINHWNPLLPKFSGEGTTYHGAYGHRIRKNFGFDQLKRAYLALEKNPDSRQVVIQIWDPTKDFPRENGSPQAADIPCNLCSLLKVRDGSLEWLQIMRSNDLYRGTPYNLVQFTILQEVLAGWLGLEIGEYHQTSDSLHVYKDDLRDLKVKFSPLKMDSTDDLRLSFDEFESVSNEMLINLKKLASKTITRTNIKAMIENATLPRAYYNLLLITIADSARRRGWYPEMHHAIHSCSNPELSLTWQAWRTRWIHREESNEAMS